MVELLDSNLSCAIVVKYTKKMFPYILYEALGAC